MAWTVDQLDAINYNGESNLLVSASAGSGKTSAMIERVALLLERGVDVERIAMLTFTTAAASEMKEKLQKKLMAKLLSASPTEKNELREQIDKITFADISTVHSFCAKLIKHNFQLVDVAPDFAILSDKEQQKYKSKALDQTIKAYLEAGDVDFYRLYESLREARSDDKLKRTIMKISTYLSAQSDEEKYINEIATEYYRGASCENAIGAYLLNYYKYKLYALKPFFDDLLLVKFECAELKKTLEDLVAKNNALLSANSIRDLYKNLDTKIKIPKAVGFEVEKDEIKSIKKLFDNVLKKIKSDLSELDTKLRSEPLIKQVADKLIQVVLAYRKAYCEQKKKIDMLDYDDLEHNAIKILSDKTALAEIKSSYDYIFVDEYQDTNYIQEKLVAAIENSNLYMVGDVKQSIYQFRLTEPQIFIDKYNDNNISKINFTTNFRSNKQILDFVNDIFSSIMTINTCGIDYDLSSRFKSLNDKKIDKEFPAVEVAIYDKAYESTDDDEQKQEKITAKGIYSVKDDKEYVGFAKEEIDAQAFYVANKIIDLVMGGHIYDIDEKGSEKTRNIEYKDITILSRSRSATAVRIADKLMALGIPIKISNFKTNKLNCDIALMINYLKLLINAKQDVELLSVLASPYGGFSLSELCEIKNFTNENSFFHEKLAKYRAAGKALSSRLDTFFDKLNADRIFCAGSDCFNILDKFIKDSEYYDYLLSVPGGRSRKTILRNFILSLKGDAVATSVEEFVANLDSYDFKLYDNVALEDNSVEITTIHASKGLEYNIVFLIDVDKRFNFEKDDIICDKDFGIALPYYNTVTKEKVDSLIGIAISKKSILSQIKEEMRILYVALTRAKKHLFITGACKKSAFAKSVKIIDADSFMDFISSAAKINHSVAKNIIWINSHAANDETSCDTINYIPSEHNNGEFNDIISLIDSPYEYSNAINLKNKYTVTELNDNDDINVQGASLVEAGEEDDDVDRISARSNVTTNAELGTLYHTVMQYIDFEAQTVEEVKNEIAQMAKNGLIDESDIEKISVDIVLKCLFSSIIDYAKMRCCHKEQKFMLYIPALEVEGLPSCSDKVLIQGIIDLLIEDGDDYIIVDYKMSSKCENALKEAYGKQLLLYKTAIEKATSKTVKSAYILSLVTAKLVKVL